ncbi:MAG: Peptodoglycan polymerase FtsW/RodA/SpoVE [Candidatus Midichloria mitochondrii]|uniref:Probable peptidoglycan glycosyltransferase FtsW n=2 Tax=Candidatus Midichloria mitochondrii TaxID=234827 RepID=F7XW67_MIDMI|nr:cell division protein [Candidatus Midichloria mitochondrii IricVA]
MLQNKRSSSFLKWWWLIDSLMFIFILSIILIGAFLTATASPGVAEKIGAPYFHFLYRQLVFLGTALGVVVLISLMSKKAIKRLALLGFVVTLILMVLVLFIGDETKGSRRWINLIGFSIQPSEILKPLYAVIVALILSPYNCKKRLFHLKSWNVYICLAIHLIICALLLMQPDFGMAITISMVTIGQLFVAGLPLIWVLVAIIFFISATFTAYKMFPHVANRINSFLNPEDSLSYQVEKSIESYVNGGIFGKGPGEGSVKLVLPDSHTDFIFAVAAEEMGALFCMIIIILFASIIIRAMIRISSTRDLFVIYAVVGVMMYFGIQSIFNIGVTLHILPTKGMTLPFISYGGSSALSFAIATGIYLSLTKKTAFPNAHYITPNYNHMRSIIHDTPSP